MTYFCQSVNLEGHGFVPCQSVATHIVWCPTWISADEGPMHLCFGHAKNFIPEHNKYASDGTFYWGEEAWVEYRKVYPNSTPKLPNRAD